MFHKDIKEGAIFIADSHYPTHGYEFLKILQKIDNQEIKTEQLFLIGDNFDLLFGYNRYIQKNAQDVIDILNRLSHKIEIHYFEGNHDFLLSNIFPNIKVYNREEQPIKFKLNNKNIYISHGDKYLSSTTYNIYSKILRNRYFIKILKPLDKKIIDYINNRLSQKNICHKFHNFENRIKKILNIYPEDTIIIEGHFHQGVIIQNYYSLPSLVCQKKIAIIRNDKIEFILFR